MASLAGAVLSTAAGLLLIDEVSLKERFHVHLGDVIDYLSLNRLLVKIEPDEIYNMAEQSHIENYI